MKTSKKLLSAYTIAENCTDKSDCQAGIDEIRDLIKVYELTNKEVPLYFYTRLGNLKVKIEMVK